MTETYKGELLNYLTGKISKQTGSNEPQFSDATQTSNNIRYQIAQEAGVNYSDIYFHQQLYNQEYQTFLILGVNNGNNNSETFIAVVDKDMQLLQYINQFSSGSSLFDIVCINQDENGQIYGVTRDEANNTTTTRVLLLNNIFASGQISGTYEIIIRRSYIVPSDLDFRVAELNNSRYRIVKSYGEAIYFLTGYGITSNSIAKVIKFQINVGSANTWDIYQINNSYLGTTNFTVLLEKNNDNIIYNLYALDFYNGDKFVYYRIGAENSIDLIKSINLNNTEVNAFTSQVFALSTNLIYVISENSNNYSQVIDKVVGNSLEQIYVSTGYSDQGTQNIPIIYLQNINNNIFVFEIKGIQGESYLRQKIGMLINDNVYMKEAGKVSAITIYSVNTDCLITNQFNLYNINIISDLDFNNQSLYVNNYVSLVYNALNYNGLSYTNINELAPNSSVLYDENNNIIFARNLYNKVINGNTTISTVEIPNTLLNEEIIATENLIGETNQILTSSNQEIEKNIYETLYLNFYNTIIMKDNNTSNPVINTIGAIRVNNSVSNLVDYENCQATKVRINFSDNSSNIITIDPNTQITISNGVATYNFLIYVPQNKTISNIEIISADENTSYATITGTFQSNKYYRITQQVYVS